MHVDVPCYISHACRMAGYRRVAQLPETLQPVLLRTMDLPIIDTYFIWPSVRDAGKNTHEKREREM